MKMKKRHRPTGHTLVEMLITVALFSFVGLFVAFLTLELAYQFRQSINQAPAQENVMRSATFVKNNLLSAEADSVAISVDGRTLTYTDPATRKTARLQFDTAAGVVVFDPDIDTPNDERNWGRNIDGDFLSIDANNRRISVSVRTETIDRDNEPLLYSYTDEVTLRN